MTGERGHWVLQLDPARSDVAARRAGGGRSDFCVRRYLRRLRIGDDVALWVSGRRPGSGFVALGSVTGEVFPDPGAGGAMGASQAAPAWEPGAPPAAGAAKVPVCLDLWLPAPVPRDVLKDSDGFAGASIIRRPFGGNPLPLTDEEWAVLLRLAGERRDEFAAGDARTPPRGRR